MIFKISEIFVGAPTDIILPDLSITVGGLTKIL